MPDVRCGTIGVPRSLGVCWAPIREAVAPRDGADTPALGQPRHGREICVRRQGRDNFVRRWRPLVDVRGGTPTVTFPPWDTRKTAARRTYKMLSNSAGNVSLAITKQLLTT